MLAREVWVIDSREYLLREVFIPRLKRDVDDEFRLTASELAAFEDEFRAKIEGHDEIMSNLALVADSQQGGFE